MTGIEIIVGIGLGLTAYVLLRALMMGFFTVAPNERAVLTSFGRAQRISGGTTLNTPLAGDLPKHRSARLVARECAKCRCALLEQYAIAKSARRPPRNEPPRPRGGFAEIRRLGIRPWLCLHSQGAL